MPETPNSYISERIPVHRGSVKNLYEVVGEPDMLDCYHTDHFSMFDRGPHQQTIPDMGESLCACTVASFKIAATLGVPTHFVRKIDSRTIRIRRFALGGTGNNRVLPLEFIDRQFVAGSLWRDFADGSKDPRDYGFPARDVPAEGTPLRWPIHQITTKREKVDRPLTVEGALRIGGILPEHLARAWSLIDTLNGGLALAARVAGLARLDGKKEVALGENGEIIIVDFCGTPHEDRFALAGPLKSGTVMHCSKEYLRQIFIANGFFARLKAARAAGEPDPDYPDLTPEQIREAATRFRELAQNYTWAVHKILA